MENNTLTPGVYRLKYNVQCEDNEEIKAGTVVDVDISDMDFLEDDLHIGCYYLSYEYDNDGYSHGFACILKNNIGLYADCFELLEESDSRFLEELEKDNDSKVFRTEFTMKSAIAVAILSIIVSLVILITQFVTKGSFSTYVLCAGLIVDITALFIYLPSKKIRDELWEKYSKEKALKILEIEAKNASKA